jgi:hypothetical protein
VHLGKCVQSKLISQRLIRLKKQIGWFVRPGRLKIGNFLKSITGNCALGVFHFCERLRNLLPVVVVFAKKYINSFSCHLRRVFSTCSFLQARLKIQLGRLWELVMEVFIILHTYFPFICQASWSPGGIWFLPTSNG